MNLDLAKEINKVAKEKCRCEQFSENINDPDCHNAFCGKADEMRTLEDSGYRFESLIFIALGYVERDNEDEDIINQAKRMARNQMINKIIRKLCNCVPDFLDENGGGVHKNYCEAQKIYLIKGDLLNEHKRSQRNNKRIRE